MNDKAHCKRFGLQFSVYIPGDIQKIHKHTNHAICIIYIREKELANKYQELWPSEMEAINEEFLENHNSKQEEVHDVATS